MTRKKKALVQAICGSRQPIVSRLESYDISQFRGPDDVILWAFCISQKLTSRSRSPKNIRCSENALEGIGGGPPESEGNNEVETKKHGTLEVV